MGSKQIQEKIKEIKNINNLLSIGQGIRYEYVPRGDDLVLTSITIQSLPENCDTLDIIIPDCIDRVDVGLQQKNNQYATRALINNNQKEKIRYLSIQTLNNNLTGYLGALILDWSVEEIDLSELNIEHVKNIDNMFNGMTRLEKLVLNPTIFKNTVHMNNTFKACKSITDLDFSSYDLSNILKADNCFEWCSKLETIKFRKDAFQKMISQTDMFEQCSKLKNININELNLSNLKYMSGMFSMCRQLEHLEIPTIGAVYDAYGAFLCCDKLRYLDIRNFDIDYRAVEASRDDRHNYDILKGQLNLETLYIRQSFVSRLRQHVQKQLGRQLGNSDKYIIDKYLKAIITDGIGTKLKDLKTTATNASEREIRAYRELTRTA